MRGSPFLCYLCMSAKKSTMKKMYSSPVSEAVKFYPADGVLNQGSIETYPIDEVGFDAPMLSPFNTL